MPAPEGEEGGLEGLPNLLSEEGKEEDEEEKKEDDDEEEETKVMRRRIWREREGIMRICRTAWGGGGHDDQNSLVPFCHLSLSP